MAKCYAVGTMVSGLPGERYYYRDLENAVGAFRGLVAELGLEVPKAEEVKAGLNLEEVYSVSGYSPEVHGEAEVWISEVNEEADCRDYPGFVG